MNSATFVVLTGRLVRALNGMPPASRLVRSRSWPADQQLVLMCARNRFVKKQPVFSCATTVHTNSGRVLAVERVARSVLFFFPTSVMSVVSAGFVSALLAGETDYEGFRGRGRGPFSQSYSRRIGNGEGKCLGRRHRVNGSVKIATHRGQRSRSDTYCSDETKW
jgi:hypothetical protein